MTKFLNHKIVNSVGGKRAFTEGRGVFGVETVLIKKAVLALSLFTLFFTFGCLEDFSEQARNFLDKEPEEKIITKTVDRPVLSYEAEKIVYYFCGIDDFDYCILGWNKFASFSEEFIHCQVKSLDEQLVADTLVELRKQNVGIKVFFDRDATYTENNYPRTDSMYGFLLRNLIPIQNGNIDDTFCVSDKGVLVGSFVPSRIRTPETSSFFVIYNTEITEPFNQRFFEAYENE